MLKPIKYQTKAVEELIEKTDACIRSEEKEMLFQAPTGSGKTVMMGRFFTEYFESHADEKIAFMWISPGKGDLAGQSRDSIAANFKDIYTLDLPSLLTQRELKANDVVFINWEAINKEGNVAIREGEQANIYDILENTRLDRLIIVVDESHEARNSIKSTELLDSFGPDIIIDVTATPRKSDRYDRMNTVKVSINDVIEEEFIKHQIIMNEGVESLELSNVLKAAVNKRDEIETSYRSKNPDCRTPLLLVQIENEKAVDTELGKRPKVVHIADTLESLGVAEEDIAIWVSDKKQCRNLDDIKNSDVKVLIFKAAIATGYDIDRAHVLCKIRDVKSEVFNAQVLGRILRTQDKRFYDEELIDSAYVYTEFDTFEYKLDLDDETKALLKEPKSEARIKAEFKGAYPRFTLPMTKKVKELEHTVDSSAFKKRLERSLSTEYINELTIDQERLTDRLMTGSLAVSGMDDTQYFSGLDHASVVKSEERIRTEYVRRTKRLTEKNRFDPSKQILSIMKKNSNVITNLDAMKLYLSNADEIDIRVHEALADYYELELRHKVKDELYQTPDVVWYRGIKEVTDESYSYTKEPDLDVSRSKSSSESLFADFLNENEDVKFWYKNGTSGTNFSIDYRAHDHSLNLYYPDFFIITRDNRLFIVDIKAPIVKNTSSDYKNIEQKYNRGKEYQHRHGEAVSAAGFKDLTFSMVKMRNGVPYICCSQTYTDDFADDMKWKNMKNELKGK